MRWGVSKTNKKASQEQKGSMRQGKVSPPLPPAPQQRNNALCSFSAHFLASLREGNGILQVPQCFLLLCLKLPL